MSNSKSISINDQLKTSLKWLMVLLWSGFIVLISLPGSSHFTQRTLGAFSLNERNLIHLTQFLFLSLLLGWALPFRKHKKLLSVTGLSSFLAVIVEFYQVFTPSRQAELIDLIMNGIGIILGLCILNLVSWWRTKRLL